MTLTDQLDREGRRSRFQAAVIVVLGLLAGATGLLGVFGYNEQQDRREGDRQEAQERAVENCRSDNATRAAVVELVRQLEADATTEGATSIFPIPVPPGAGADVVALIEHVNSAASPAPDTPGQSATELAEETLPRKDCSAL